MRHYKTLWLSDIHLGSKDCKADMLCDFLDNISVETLYLVGDIIDIWQLSKNFMWPESHNAVLHKLLQLNQTGTRVIYVPGNHDEPLKKYTGMLLGEIEIYNEIIHTTAKGKRYLVVHGDKFDQEVTLGKFHQWMGDHGYNALLAVNRWYNHIQSKRNRRYWSLAGYIKSKLAGANTAIARYRQACCRYAKQQHADGIICGHIHHPESIFVDDIHYVNDGDWVENCSALSEDLQGNLTLIDWTQNHLHNVYPLPLSKNTKAA